MGLTRLPGGGAGGYSLLPIPDGLKAEHLQGMFRLYSPYFRPYLCPIGLHLACFATAKTSTLSNLQADDSMFEDEEDEEEEDEEVGARGAEPAPLPLRSAPQDSSAALNAAAMVRRIREQQKNMPAESPTRAMDALAGG